MNKKLSKWLAFAALLMFAGAAFRITRDHYMPGVVCFAAAVSFACSAEVYRKTEKEVNRKEADNK